jgi:3-hydroxyisobutyrate dehydrogenase-like beta-hydroxyacid dehydrogenase
MLKIKKFPSRPFFSLQGGEVSSMTMKAASLPTVGIIYPGEMGSTLGRLLAQGGVPVVTTCEGRSDQTRRRAEEAGLTVLADLTTVAARADVVLSTVSPAAALPVAQRYLAGRPAAGRRQVYVDLNSTSPETARQVENAVIGADLSFVDGAIHGLASALPERGTLYLSGADAPVLAELFGRALRVKVLGREAGQASAFKMMISGLAKGVVALFVEMSLAAQRSDLLEDYLTCCREAYPGILALAERLLPTYPRHAGRRAEEAAEVEQFLQSVGLRPCLTRGTREVTEELARAALDEPDTRSSTVLELIAAFATRGMLAASSPNEFSWNKPSEREADALRSDKF